MSILYFQGILFFSSPAYGVLDMKNFIAIFKRLYWLVWFLQLLLIYFSISLRLNHFGQFLLL